MEVRITARELTGRRHGGRSILPGETVHTKDSQFTYTVILRRVLATIVGVEKQ
jgi:hypothetical protein